MPKLRAISGGKEKGKSLSLVYGVRVYRAGEIAGIDEGTVTLSDGSTSHITLHLIEGTREQIRAQLLTSIDAFFEIASDLPTRRVVPAPRRTEGDGNDPGC